MKGNNPQHETTEPQPGSPAADVEAPSSVATGTEVASGDGQESAAELRAKIEKLEDALLRSRADLQNAQRRATTERLDAVRFANAELLKSLVGVVDDLERALANTNQAKAEAVSEGVRLVHQNLLKALADHGLETIDALGQPFDPALHEALLQQPSPHKPGTVIEQVAKG